jgi:HEPN domain-containing protein
MKKPEKLIEPAAIFRHAETFTAALDHLHRTLPRENLKVYMLPMMVLSAFASEVYLKCLICLETGSVAKGHHLFDLFKKLSPKTQGILERRWDAVMVQRADILDKLDAQMARPMPRDLRSNLIEGNRGFELIRYVYEGGDDFRFPLSDLPIPLRETIFELKPSSLLGRLGRRIERSQYASIALSDTSATNSIGLMLRSAPIGAHLEAWAARSFETPAFGGLLRMRAE